MSRPDYTILKTPWQKMTFPGNISGGRQLLTQTAHFQSARLTEEKWLTNRRMNFYTIIIMMELTAAVFSNAWHGRALERSA